MKKFKSCLALILVACLILALLAACSKSPEEGENQGNTGNNSSQNNTNTNTEQNPNDNASEGNEEDLVDLVFNFYCATTFTEEGVQRVQDEMNKILNDKIGVNVELRPFALAEYRQTTSLAIAGGEKLDVCCLFGGVCSFSSMMSSNQLQDIAPYLNTYAADTLEVVKDTIGAYSVNGGIYAVPNHRNFAANLYVVANKATLESLGLLDQFYAMDNWADYEEIMQIVKDNTDMWPIGGQKYVMWTDKQPITWSSDSFEYDVYDTLGDSMNIIHADIDTAEVCSVFDVEGTKWMMQKAKKWMDAGFAYPDSYLTQESNQALLGSETIFSLIIHSELGIEANWSARAGLPVACAQICETPKLVSTNTIETGSMVVPVTCDDPEAAVRFINEFYTNPDIVNLFDWGVEGFDYVINENGEAAYPNGDSSVGYHSADFAGGNFFLALPWEGTGADYREKAAEANAKAIVSPFLGFVPDGTNLETYAASIAAVYDENVAYLNGGFYSDEGYQEMMEKFESVGLREYIAEYQTQLDAWIAANK